ncbi:Uncharacterised protein [Leminorella richardii]|uniref:Mu-like prophage FluMu N-terminal domain-containing protein n=1 Tax=Leminorella richardii TaxID=158841 RepID=A0A2X4UH85_9GAMM|nr:HI1506-related protein [Leminorella richardii]SQI34948.1 Uncharacterised protein [Leminorella richardii]
MQNDIEHAEAVEVVGVLVVNTAHDGYCRAGFRLNRGENTLPPVTAQQWALLEGDPRLHVSVIADDIPPAPSGEEGSASGFVVDNVLPSSQLTAMRDDVLSEVAESGGEDVVSTPIPENLEPVGEQVPPPVDERLLAAVMACKIEPREKWFTKTGTPLLKQWREFVRADLSADDIKAALDVHGVK